MAKRHDERSASRPRERAIVAWRFWDVAEDDAGEFRLRSPYRSTGWPVGEPLQAECLGLNLAGDGGPPRRHAAPGEGCRCGVYGSTYRELRAFLRTNLLRPSSVPILGRVLLWGVVRADAYGWRASLAYPEQLLVPTLSRNAYEVADGLGAYDVGLNVLDLRETFRTLNPSTRVRLAE